MHFKVREFLETKPVRRAVREKFLRAVDEVVRRHHEEQLAETHRRIDRLEAQLARQVNHAVDQAAERAIDRIVEFEVRTRKDIVYAGDVDSALSTSRFTREHLTAAHHCASPRELREYALSLAPSGGMALEFGVATGSTLATIVEHRDDKQVYGFDSFRGLPEDWLPGMPAGTFAREDLPDVPGAELVVGLFSDTLPRFLETHPGRVDFLHVDSDLYSSSVTVLEHVGPRLRPGSVIVFDEFFNYPGWERHEYRAWTEYVARTGGEFAYEAYNYQGDQVAIRLK